MVRAYRRGQIYDYLHWICSSICVCVPAVLSSIDVTIAFSIFLFLLPPQYGSLSLAHFFSISHFRFCQSISLQLSLPSLYLRLLALSRLRLLSLPLPICLPLSLSLILVISLLSPPSLSISRNLPPSLSLSLSFNRCSFFVRLIMHKTAPS